MFAAVALPISTAMAQNTNDASAIKLQIAGDLIVTLDARDPSAGSATWDNKGSMGNFVRIGSPKVSKAAGQTAVQFNGTTDAYRSVSNTPSTITGAHARTIEVWAFNPTLDSAEECMVAWGHRGATLGNLSFNYGTGAGYSAVTHYDQDMGWGDDSPEADHWHLLTYTYSGKTAKIYADGVERDSKDFQLATVADTKMNIAVENSEEGDPLFSSEFGDPGWALSLSGYIAVVRVHSGALSGDQVKANFNAEKARFGVGQ